MSARNSRKNPAKPATRSNYLATPTISQPRDPTMPQGMQTAYQQHPQAGESPPHRDTESPKGTRDAGPSGIHPWVDDPTTPANESDTEAPPGPRDADPPGSRRPRIDDPPAQTHDWDTEAPQGPRDAGPLGTRHPRTDDHLTQGYNR